MSFKGRVFTFALTVFSLVWSAQANADVLQATSIKLLNQLYRLGAHQQLALNCGIPANRQKSLKDAHDIILSVFNYIQTTQELSPGQKQEFGSPATAEQKFQDGKRALEAHPLDVSSTICGNVKASWASNEAEWANYAGSIQRLRGQLPGAGEIQKK